MAKKKGWSEALKLIAAIFIAVSLGMIYWSLQIIEEQLMGIRSGIDTFQGSLENISKENLSKENANKPMNTPMPSSDRQVASQSYPSGLHIDEKYPNILEEDPFYSKTLPELLGPSFQPHGILTTSTLGKPDNLHPFGGFVETSNWIGLCSISAGAPKFGFYESLAPDMAFKIEERPRANGPGIEYWVHLRTDVFWQPLRQQDFPQLTLAPHFLKKHQVTADDFKFYLDAILNPHVQNAGAMSLKTYLEDIEELQVIDPLTFVVRWKLHEWDGELKQRYIAKGWTAALRPLARFVYQYFADGQKIIDDEGENAYRTNSAWAQNFTDHWAKNCIVSCGPWIFDGWSDRAIHFRRNQDHYMPLEALLEERVVLFKNSNDSAWQDFKNNAIQMYGLPAEQELELDQFMTSQVHSAQKKKGEGIERLQYPARLYTYVAWNQQNDLFKSAKIRRALTMAIDRQRIIKQFLNGRGVETTGTFYRFSSAYDDAIDPWPYDPSLAMRILEEEGWAERDGSGVLRKNEGESSKPFSFALSYYVKNPLSKAIAEYIATALRAVHIDCQLKGLDYADLSNTTEDKSFDALLMAWGLGTPPEDAYQLWHSSQASLKGSSNIIGFKNAAADKIIEDLLYESEPEKRIALYHRFDAILHDQAPYTFLYSPLSTLLYRATVQNVFIPADRHDLIPGAVAREPNSAIFWLKE